MLLPGLFAVSLHLPPPWCSRLSDWTVDAWSPAPPSPAPARTNPHHTHVTNYNMGCWRPIWDAAKLVCWAVVIELLWTPCYDPEWWWKVSKILRETDIVGKVEAIQFSKQYQEPDQLRGEAECLVVKFLGTYSLQFTDIIQPLNCCMSGH